ncbi:MAG: TolC family protein, partial [Gallionella sp.]|nr:TolC family protein [Gallionella sp.]
MRNLYLTSLLLGALTFASQSQAADLADLPPHEQVDIALDKHISVSNAHSQLQIDLINQRKRENGEYEFTVRGGIYEDYFFNPGGREGYRDWEIALERPFRLPNKMFIDSEIGAEGVARGENALGDARHEASRALLQLWFNWQRERIQLSQWQQQVDILTQQAAITEKRIKAGDAPRMELNQVNAVTALAGIASQQARLRAELAANELSRQFSAIKLPQIVQTTEPQPISGELAHWRQTILRHNHELGLIEAETRMQSKLAERARADRIPDPTLGVRYASQLNNNQKISGVYFSLPLPSGHRSSTAESATLSAQIANDREQAVRARLDADIFTAYTKAVNSYQIWQQARDAAIALRQNAELVARAYGLGESSLGETLVARRQALESSLAESIARLDANEARYRLLL